MNHALGASVQQGGTGNSSVQSMLLSRDEVFHRIMKGTTFRDAKYDRAKRVFDIKNSSAPILNDLPDDLLTPCGVSISQKRRKRGNVSVRDSSLVEVTSGPAPSLEIFTSSDEDNATSGLQTKRKIDSTNTSHSGSTKKLLYSYNASKEGQGEFILPAPLREKYRELRQENRIRLVTPDQRMIHRNCSNDDERNAKGSTTDTFEVADSEGSRPSSPLAANIPPVLTDFREVRDCVELLLQDAPMQHRASCLASVDVMIRNLARRGMFECTPVQMQVLPLLLASRNALVCAPTGSGKTLSYLFPAVLLQVQRRCCQETHRQGQLLTDDSRDSSVQSVLRSVVFVPTKEIAIQVEREVFFLSESLKMRIMHIEKSKSQLNKQEIVVTTPARLAGIVEEGKASVRLDQLEYIILDEVDNLLDPNSAHITHLQFLLHGSHQTTPPVKSRGRKCSQGSDTRQGHKCVVAMFSATITQVVAQRAQPWFFQCSGNRGYYTVTVGARAAAIDRVEQSLLFAGDERGKVEGMRNLIQDGIAPPVLIFVQSTQRCEELYRELYSPHLRLERIHAGLTTEERCNVVERFRVGTIWMLITTDLLARGVDFRNVGTVINFDIPRTREIYIHRIGRAGRVGSSMAGKAVTLFTTDDGDVLRDLAEVIHRAGWPVDEWILNLKRESRKQRRIAHHSTPRRHSLSATAPQFD